MTNEQSFVITLGIETSCDETAAALVRDGHEVLADVVSTQIDIHRRWGGVVPELASRNHVVQVMPVIDEALKRAKLSLDDVDEIAVTQGPGLQGALLVGLEVAKALSAALEVPFVGVNHLEGHLLAARLMSKPVEAPFLGLVVSGGHTTLYEVPTLGTYRKLGTTRDDAAGEAYDKVAKLLGLPYPGGLPIDQMARKGKRDAIRFPRALPNKDILDWSFSGLKTAVSLHVKEHGVPTEGALFDLCASFQEAVADALTRKLQLAIEKTASQRVVLAGGVAANSRLRELAAERVSAHGAQLYLPSIDLCTDNGAMIAVAGHEAMKRGLVSDFALDAQPNWRL